MNDKVTRAARTLEQYTESLQAAKAAVATLMGLRYTYHGGIRWKPPLGKLPAHITGEPANAESTRGQFERWVSKRWGYSVGRWADSGNYHSNNTRELWECWLLGGTAIGTAPAAEQDPIDRDIIDEIRKAAGLANTPGDIVELIRDLRIAALDNQGKATGSGKPFAWYRPRYGADSDQEPEFRTTPPPDGHGWIPVPGETPPLGKTSAHIAGDAPVADEDAGAFGRIIGAARSRIDGADACHGEQWKQGARTAINFIEDRLQRAGRPAAQAAPNGTIVGWWNGIMPDATGRSPYGPSVRWGASAQNSGHDIPLYDGYNPIHYQAPAAPAVAVDEDDEFGNPPGYTDWYNQQFAGQHVDTKRDHDCEVAWRAAVRYLTAALGQGVGRG